MIKYLHLKASYIFNIDLNLYKKHCLKKKQTFKKIDYIHPKTTRIFFFNIKCEKMQDIVIKIYKKRLTGMVAYNKSSGNKYS